MFLFIVEVCRNPAGNSLRIRCSLTGRDEEFSTAASNRVGKARENGFSCLCQRQLSSVRGSSPARRAVETHAKPHRYGRRADFIRKLAGRLFDLRSDFARSLNHWPNRFVADGLPQSLTYYSGRRRRGAAQRAGRLSGGTGRGESVPRAASCVNWRKRNSNSS